MKKSRFILIFLTAITIFCTVFTSCSSPSQTDLIYKNVGIDLQGAEVIHVSDSHGGFMGDGLTIAIFDCSASPITKQFESLENWKPYPLDENAKKAIYDVADEISTKVPEFENGFYTLIDRQPDDYKEQEPDMFKRASFNFTVSVYDTAKNIFYYFELDT